MSVPDGLRTLAEELFFVTPPPRGANRVVTDRFVLHAPASGNPAFTGIGRILLGDDEVDSTVDELRTRFAGLGHTSMAWWVSPSSQPADLGDRLRAHGFRPLEGGAVEAVQTAMVATRPPVAGSHAFEARRVDDLDDFRAALAVYNEVMGIDKPTSDGDVRREYEERHLSGDVIWYVARCEGEIVASASAHFTSAGAALNGGFTRERFRGRGAYRALVRARWDDAVAAGAPGLAVLAGELSRPILAGVGFQSLGSVEVLVDDFASRAS